MQTAKRILTYLAVGFIVLLLGGLTGWYLLLRSKTAAINTVDTGRGLSSSVSAFGGTLGSTVANTVQALLGSGTTTPQQTPAQRLWQVDGAPVAGEAFASGGTAHASSTTLLYMERGNGYVFSADASTQQTRRLTNTLLPNTYQALFVPPENAVLIRSLSAQGVITTTYANFSATTSDPSSVLTALTSEPLPNNIRRIAVDPSGSSLFTLSLDPTTGAAIGETVSLPKLAQKQAFISPFASWEVAFSPQGITLTETPADGLAGYAYLLKNTGALSPLFGPLPGLSVLPNPSQKAFLYSTSDNGTLSLYAQVGTGAPKALSIHTVVDKCVWAPGASLTAYCAVPNSTSSTHFLDDWYQGIVHTVDTWWIIDASAGTAQELYAPTQALDAERPTTDPSGNYIAFINGGDQSLWLLKIVQ